MDEFVSVIFCRRCGSRYVEINRWNNDNAVLFCRTCENSVELPGFTLGRCRVTKKELAGARGSAATLDKFEK